MGVPNTDIAVSIRKDFSGIIKPVKFYITNIEGKQTEYKIIRIVRRDEEIIDSQKTTIYSCLIEFDNLKQVCDIRLNHITGRWMLVRMQP